ncbi:hypothetical protein [Pandoraea iniqua]|uniref:hypothetical protein n=1 Tax=Pandoraea iniqua TaxID=2508288 RepID=UPI001584032A|nr:hypothetical protein [Pandoraea iniqua]
MIAGFFVARRKPAGSSREGVVTVMPESFAEFGDNDGQSGSDFSPAASRTR